MITKLTKNEILIPAGGGSIWKKVGNLVGEINQSLQKEAETLGNKAKEAWKDYKTGREEAKNNQPSDL